MKCFDTLPLAAIVNTTQGRFFCVHGGLSPWVRAPQDVNRLERFEEPPTWGPVCDLLWSDPADEKETMGMERDELAEWQKLDFKENAVRGCGQRFGYEATKRFLEDNQLACIIRAHEVQASGYKEHRFRSRERRPLPMVITVFSAPNYW